MSELKPGARALVVNADHFKEMIGKVVLVEAFASLEAGRTYADFGCSPRGSAHLAVTASRIYAVYTCESIRWVIRPSYLIPLPPDDECKRLFRETEKGVPA